MRNLPKPDLTERGAARLDAADPLARFRAFFALQAGQIYLDGNSLGLLSHPAERALHRVLNEWRDLGVSGWTDADPPWFALAEAIAARMAALVGAEEGAVAVTGSTTGNLHQLLATLFRPENRRAKILADVLNFPSDLYALASHLRLRGLDPDAHLIRVGSRDGLTLEVDELIEAMTPEVGLALFPSVVYTSGQLLDMQRITAAARERGITIGWDCSHSVGVVPHRFDEWGVDFAVWCGYKYLNGGPGATGALYLNRRHWGKAPGLAGWWGSRKEAQFDMGPEMEPASDAGAMQVGTPHLLSLAPLGGALEVTTEAGIEAIRRKSLALTGYLTALVDGELATFGFRVVTPEPDDERGGHVALVHPEATRICKALRDASVVPDYRHPDIVRLAPVPLYTSFAECREAVLRLRRIMQDGAYESYPSGRGRVA